MAKKNITRRNFIKTVSAGTAGMAIGLPSVKHRRVLRSNDKVRVGIVGFSDRARHSLIPAFHWHAEELNFEIVAVSDIWSRRREEGVTFLEKLTGKKVAPMRNNEELYDSGMVDAVIISTADFQHALHCIQGVEAGCDVYVEKPFANTMADARAALKTVTSADKIVQIGTQRRSAPNYIKANEFIRSGRFGDIIAVEMTWNVNQPGRWRRPQLVADLKEQDVDWKRYLMNRPYEPWDPRKYIEYRLFWPYSSGIPGQWMVHQIDTVHWFTDLPRPRTVVVNGGLYLWKDGRKNFDTLTAVFDYGPLKDLTRGFMVTYSSRQTNSAGGVKELYFSNGGSLNLDTNMVTPTGGLTQRMAQAMEMEENRLAEFSLAEEGGVETAANTGSDPTTLAHMRNWMECVRSRQKPNADILAGYNHSVALCMTIAAMHTGKRVTFNDSKQKVIIG
ncbi:MAG: Gfo/Idh/MocA family oxidoreductase [Candidatus Aminicenantes bacterium]|nr:MAG: Gfo/Idh/MocA family oxidoreductase [Candidatus Aminicenantes bacterium]